MVNKIILIGRVGAMPEVKTFGNGNKVANFSLATTESYKNKNGEKVEETEWSNISIFGPLADVAEKYVNKGDLLYVEGKKKTRTYDDKNGNKQYVTDIICREMKMLGSKKDNTPEGGHSQEYLDKQREENRQRVIDSQEPEQAKGSNSDNSEMDDLPF